jgi:hypothetical protein
MTYLDQAADTAVASLHRINGNEHIQCALKTRCLDEIRSTIDYICRSDFNAGRTLSVDGWVSCQTELDLIVVCGIAQIQDLILPEQSY